MKLLLISSLLISSLSFASSNDEYSNFPTVSNTFKDSDSCQIWLAEKMNKYGERVIKTASGCEVKRERMISHSQKGGTFTKKVIGTIILDTI